MHPIEEQIDSLSRRHFNSRNEIENTAEVIRLRLKELDLAEALHATLADAVELARRKLSSELREKLIAGRLSSCDMASPAAVLRRDTQRLSSLVHSMNEQIAQSEAQLSKVFASSSVLDDAGREFALQTQHIDTSRSLLAKYARDELCGNVILAIVLCIYVLVVFWIVYERVIARFW